MHEDCFFAGNKFVSPPSAKCVPWNGKIYNTVHASRTKVRVSYTQTEPVSTKMGYKGVVSWLRTCALPNKDLLIYTVATFDAKLHTSTQP